MEGFTKLILKMLVLALLVVSCSHQSGPERSVAQSSCWENVKSDYHSYFESVEKCIEKDQQK